MRVGFTGAQGTGKTTVLKAVESAGMGFKIVPSTARTAVEHGFKVNRDADPLSQLVTTISRIAEEDTLYRQTRKTLSDRTPLDSLAYTSYQAAYVWPYGEELRYYWSISSRLVREHMYKYDYIIYFPPYFPPKNDGLRDEDVDYQKQIDSILLDSLKIFEIPYYTMPNANTQDRLAWLTNLLN